jgi:hypothetical protein
MVPSGFTLEAWQPLHDRASAPDAIGGWPAGGIPWQEVQVTGVVSVQLGVARDPLTAPKVKFP